MKITAGNASELKEAIKRNLASQVFPHLLTALSTAVKVELEQALHARGMTLGLAQDIVASPPQAKLSLVAKVGNSDLYKLKLVFKEVVEKHLTTDAKIVALLRQAGIT